MSMDIENLKLAVRRADDAMKDLEQVLNEADSKLGDGDTGGMLARVTAKMAEVDLTDSMDLGSAFAALARAALSETGSSLGTLLATGLMALAKETRLGNSVDWAELSSLMASARDAMLARGGAKLGDKTVLDGLDAVVKATAGLNEPRQIAAAARHAASEALNAYRPKRCNMGRARMFAEKSVGIDDPGMLAFERLTHQVARG